MLTLKEVIESHSDRIKNTGLSFIQDRLGVRLCQFLTEEQAKTLGFSLKEGHTWTPPIPFTEENVLAQLKQDVLFGWEKACNHRGISSGLMYDVVKGWCQILQNEFANFDNYSPYGTPLFIAVSEKYGFGIDPEEFLDEDED